MKQKDGITFGDVYELFDLMPVVYNWFKSLSEPLYDMEDPEKVILRHNPEFELNRHRRQWDKNLKENDNIFKEFKGILSDILDSVVDFPFNFLKYREEQKLIMK